MAAMKGPQKPQKPQKPGRQWQIGDIAFLKQAEAFSQTERAELLDTRRVFTGATGHPVIILASSNDSRYYIVMTVSAYGSGDHNNNLPPWRQSAHQRKEIDAFRAFEGSARPNDTHKALRLADNKQWPKVETSWVYIYYPFLVPATTLIHYTKSRSQLRMEPSSLEDLLGHAEAKSRQFRQQKAEIMAKRTPSQPAARPCQPNELIHQSAVRAPQPIVRDLQQSWRRGDNENARAPVISHTTTASENPKLTDVTNAAQSKPLWNNTAAKSTAIGVPQLKGKFCNRTPRNRFVMLA